MEILDGNLTLGTFIGKITTKIISWKEGSLMWKFENLERILHQKKHPVIFLNLASLLLRNKRRNLTSLSCFCYLWHWTRSRLLRLTLKSLFSLQTASSAIKGAIQLGIGYTVGNLTSKPDRDVLMQDFYVVESVFLPR